MNILALDASTTAVGWAVFEDGEYRKSGVYVPKGKVWWERVRRVGAWIRHQLPYWRVEAIGYEIATGRHGNVHTDRALGAVEYVARNAVYMYDSTGMEMMWPSKFVAVTASQVRATECHKKNLSYAVAIKGAALTEKYEGDEADAIGVGLAAWGKLKEERWSNDL